MPMMPPAMEPETTPATPPAETEPTDDLFGPSETETTPPAAEPTTPAAEDDLFAPAEPAAEPAPSTEEPSAPAEDDLFGPPAETTPPAEEEATPPAEESEEEDDLFSNAGAILHQAGGLGSVELRRWVDDTGRHSCRGRLIRMLDGKVRLRKENGRTTTVPLSRLSAEDLAFVHRQASAERSQNLGLTAQLDASR
jgi:hypothetical protein